MLVEFATEPASPELVAALLRACSRAVEAGECRLADPRGTNDEPAPRATITWTTATSVSIVVAIPQLPEPRARTLAFDHGEDPVEVFTAVGFATGTLANEPEPIVTEPPPPPATPPPATPPVLPPVMPPTPTPLPIPPRPRRWGTDLAGFLGPARVDQAWRAGASLRAGRLQGVLFDAEARVAVHQDRAPELTSRWFLLGLGTGYALASRVGTLELRAGVGVEALEFVAVDPTTRLRATGGRWVGVARTAVDGTAPIAAYTSVLVGVGLDVPFGSTSLRVQGVEQPRAVTLPAGVRLGVRQRF